MSFDRLASAIQVDFDSHRNIPTISQAWFSHVFSRFEMQNIPSLDSRLSLASSLRFVQAMDVELRNSDLMPLGIRDKE